MVRFPDIVRASPESVWQALLDPATRTLDPRLATEAHRDGGAVRYQGRRGAWQENVLEEEADRRLVLERRDGGVATARLEWNLQPVDLGTLLVLVVKGTTVKESLRHALLLRLSYRRTIRAIKKRTEARPPSRLDLPGASAPDVGPSSAAPEPALPVAAPMPVRRATRARRARKG